MRRVSVRLGAMILMLTVGWALSGCHNDQRAAEETTHNFLEAAKKGDMVAVKANMTTKAVAKMNQGSMGQQGLKQSAGADYTLGPATIDGDTAQTPVTWKQQGKETLGHIKLRREEGQWKVYALAVPLMPNTPEITIDFENPEAALGEIMRQMPQAMGQAMKAMGKGNNNPFMPK